MSGKVKVKQIKKSLGDVDMSGMFEEMMGLKDAEPDIIIPKYVAVRNTLRYVCKVLNQFSDVLLKDFPKFSQGLEDIKKFVTELKETNGLTPDTDETEEPYLTMSKVEINAMHRKQKENQHIKTLIALCSVLDRHKLNFNNPDNLRENFINQEPGLSYMLFSFSSLDFKALWSEPTCKSSVKRYILTVFSKLHERTHVIYKSITSPDVDVKKFTSILVSSIGDLKKIPELSRCGNAFKRIEQSVELLNNKFEDYYRESVATENPDMLVMNYIMDVSSQGGANAALAREFRVIVQYMNKMSEKSGKSKDPNVQKIFQMLNNNFSLMEKNITK